MRKRKNSWGLLPYEREDLHGLSTDDGQYMGWEITLFNVQNLWQQSTGKGVVVAVIDTGCDINHNDLKNNIIEGKNFIEPNKDPMDHNGHGTHVSGTIAAQNNNRGMVGVAPETKIMPLKALNDEGQGDPNAIANALVYAADRGVDFVTMSLGSPAPFIGIEKAINYAVNKNVVIFCAAGNAGERSPIMYPAKYDNVICIGAIDKNLERTSFSCSGEELDFLAPGHEIVSTVPNHGYAIMSGTSMSNPFAVGCASLLLSYLRNNNIDIPKKANDYINIFKQSSKHLSNPRYSGKKEYEGYGILYPVL